MFRLTVTLLLATAAALYGRGWPRYAAERDSHPPELENSIDTPRHSQPILFGVSLLVAAVALLSPLHELASQFFFLRVAQHLLLISLFPALFMHSNPLPVMANGWQFNLAADTLAKVRQATSKGLMWFLFVATVWLWYDPTLHALTLARPWVRPLELGTLTVAGLFHWWHITGASPRLHRKLPSMAHIGYTFAGAAPLKIPGLFLLFSLHNSFPTYPGTELWGWVINPLTSQQIGGMLIWVLGGTVYSTSAFRFLSQWFDLEAKKPERPRHLWDNREAMLAPGVDE